jgi:hypothetical protein
MDEYIIEDLDRSKFDYVLPGIPAIAKLGIHRNEALPGSRPPALGFSGGLCLPKTWTSSDASLRQFGCLDD